MNKALEFMNWRQGGRHYVLKASSENKWAGFQESVIVELRKKFGDDFFLVIWSEKSKERDFYNIPFRKVNHLFTDEHKTTGKYPDRWTAIIWEDQFLMHSNSRLAVDIKEDYGNLHNEAGGTKGTLLFWGQRGRCCFSDLRSFLAVCSAFGAGKAGPKNHEVSDAKSPPAPGPRGFC